MNKIISWMAENHVTSNLLMILIIIGGVGSLLTLRQEVFPETSLDMVTVSVVYPGASPDEIERSIIINIEDALVGLDGVNKVTSTASEGMALVSIEAVQDYDLRKLKDKIETEVSRITSFPEESKDPVITEVEVSMPAIQIGVAGAISERELKELAVEIQDELRADPHITQVALSGLREYEISIEVSESSLQKYGLTFQQVMAAVSRGSLDLPGGKIRSKDGDILLRTRGLAKETADFEELIIKALPGGDVVRLHNVAKVKNSFEDSDLKNYFNGQPAAMIFVNRTGDENVLKVTEAVKSYIETKEKSLPEGVELITLNDRSELLQQRIDLLTRNGKVGLFLVLLVLALFLDIRLAFWVATGIGLSFLGAFWVMSLFNVSINMISLFAFIIVLGIVVDDAIVVGENIFSEREKGEQPLPASKKGAIRIAIPVVFAVLTTVATFSPMLSVEGMMGKIMYQVPIIVISVLLFSLIESLLILPSHIAGLKIHSSSKIIRASQELSRNVDAGLSKLVQTFYVPLLKRVVKWPSLVIGISVAVLFLTFGLIQAGKIKTENMPHTEGDNISVNLTFPQGISSVESEAIVMQFAENAKVLEREFKESHPDFKGELFEHVHIVVGAHTTMRPGAMPTESVGDPTLGEINLQFQSGETRDFELKPLLDRWRALNSSIVGVETAIYTNSLMSAGDDISYKFSHPNEKQLLAAVERFKDELHTYKGVVDIRDDFEPGKEELQFQLKPLAHSVGLTLSDIAMQVRQGFYGGEAIRLQRGKDDIAVMVRYSAEERANISTIQAMRIRTPQGGEVALQDVATVTLGRGFSTIYRSEQRRIVTVSAGVNTEEANASEVNGELKRFIKGEQKKGPSVIVGKVVGRVKSLLGKNSPKEESYVLMKAYPGLKMVIGGAQEDTMRGMASLGRGFIVALFVVYILLAVPFKSYVQPFIIMSAIPFGIIGAVFGHLLMGYNLSMISMMGIVALAGVVVNDSLVFVDFVNEKRREGMHLNDAIIEAGTSRFRPILLTTLTTFVGLLPMIFERSFQAKILIPMAISLGFGIIFATMITLILVPAYLRLLDWTERKARKYNPRKLLTEAPNEEA